MNEADRAGGRRVQELFAAALELPADERDAFLHRECSDDAVRAEVLELLGVAGDAEVWLARFAERAGIPAFGDVRDAAPTIPALDAPLDHIGVTAFGAYRVVRPLAAGGMGVVFLAERADGQFDKQVAVKLLPPGYGAPAHHERFLAERRILAGLEHPGIARLIDAGVTVTGAPWFIMEYVIGAPVDVWCDEHRLSIDARLDVFLQVCDVVAYAHERKVLHRDLKPRNILVNERGRVKLLDFGIATVLDDELTIEMLTLWGGSPLTPAYASPEQIEGETVGPPSDIYQLGVLLYHLLTGRLPYVLSGLSLAQMRRVVNEQAPPPPAALVLADEDGRKAERAEQRGSTPQALSTRLTGDLESVVLRALHKDPGNRYASVADFAEDVRRCRRGERTDGRRRAATGTREIRKRMSLPRGRLLGSAVLVTALSLVALLGPLRRGVVAAADTAAVIVPLPFVVQGGTELEYLSAGMVTLLSANLDGMADLRVADPYAVMAAVQAAPESSARLDAAAQLSARFGADYFVMGEVVASGDRVRITARLIRAVARGPPERQFTAEGHAAEALQLVDGISADILAYLLPREHARSAARTATSIPALRHFVSGEEYYRSGRYGDAAAAYQSAIREDSAFALAYHRLSMAMEWGGIGSTRDEMAAAEAAFRFRDRLPSRESLLVLGHFHYRQHENLLAEHYYTELVRRYPESIEGWYELGELLYHRQPAMGAGLSGARHAFERVLYYDPNHIQAISHLARIAAAERRSGELRELVTRYVAHSIADEGRSLELRALLAMSEGDAQELQDVRAALARHDENRRWLTAVRAAIYTGNIEDALPLLEGLFEGTSRGMQALALYTAGQMEMAQGRIPAARARLPALRVLSADAAAVLHAQIVLHPLIAPDAAELAAAARALRELPRTVDHPDIYFLVNNRTRNELIIWLGGRVAIARADSAAALTRIGELDALDNGIAASYARELRARLAHAAGDASFALTIMESGGRAVGVPYVTGSPLAMPQHDGRLLRAQLLAAAGRGGEAIGWLESLIEDYPFVIALLPVSYLWRSELHEALGEHALARENRQRFEALWRGGGSALATIRNPVPVPRHPTHDGVRLFLGRVNQHLDE